MVLSSADKSFTRTFKALILFELQDWRDQSPWLDPGQMSFRTHTKWPRRVTVCLGSEHPKDVSWVEGVWAPQGPTRMWPGVGENPWKM